MRPASTDLVIVVKQKASKITLQKEWLAIRPELAIKDNVSCKLSLKFCVGFKVHFGPRCVIGRSLVSWHEERSES